MIGFEVVAVALDELPVERLLLIKWNCCEIMPNELYFALEGRLGGQLSIILLVAI